MIKTFLLAVIALFSFREQGYNLNFRGQNFFRQDLTAQGKLLDSNKVFFFDSSDVKHLSGSWEGYMISITSDPCRLDIHLAVNDVTSKVTGRCSIYLPHFQPVDPDEREMKIADSIWDLKDVDLWKKHVQRKHREDSIEYTTYIESYSNVSGFTRADSIYFQIDTIYSLKENQRIRYERHYRFAGKYMKWFSVLSPDKVTYFITGNFIDSAFQRDPTYGTFMAYKHK
jgi:hypothetical protein